MSVSALSRISNKLHSLQRKLELLVVESLEARGIEESPFCFEDDEIAMLTIEFYMGSPRLIVKTPRLKCEWGFCHGGLEEAIRLKGWNLAGVQSPKVLGAVLVLVEDDLPTLAAAAADEFVRINARNARA